MRKDGYYRGLLKSNFVVSNDSKTIPEMYEKKQFRQTETSALPFSGTCNFVVSNDSKTIPEMDEKQFRLTETSALPISGTFKAKFVKESSESSSSSSSSSESSSQSTSPVLAPEEEDVVVKPLPHVDSMQINEQLAVGGTTRNINELLSFDDADIKFADDSDTDSEERAEVVLRRKINPSSITNIDTKCHRGKFLNVIVFFFFKCHRGKSTIFCSVSTSLLHDHCRCLIIVLVMLLYTTMPCLIIY